MNEVSLPTFEFKHRSQVSKQRRYLIELSRPCFHNGNTFSSILYSYSFRYFSSILYAIRISIFCSINYILSLFRSLFVTFQASIIEQVLLIVQRRTIVVLLHSESDNKYSLTSQKWQHVFIDLTNI